MRRRRFRRGGQKTLAFFVEENKCRKCGCVLPPAGPCGGCLNLARDTEQILANLKEFPDPHCDKKMVRALAQCDINIDAERAVDKWIKETTARIREGWSEETFRERSGSITVGIVSRPTEVGV